MEQIFSYTYRYCDGSGLLSKCNEYIKTSHGIVVQNDKCLVIDNDRFTTLAREGVNMGELNIESPNLSISVDDKCSGNSVYFIFYSATDYSDSEIKEIVKSKVAEKINFLSDLDFSMIDQVFTEEIQP